MTKPLRFIVPQQRHRQRHDHLASKWGKQAKEITVAISNSFHKQPGFHNIFQMAWNPPTRYIYIYILLYTIAYNLVNLPSYINYTAHSKKYAFRVQPVVKPWHLWSETPKCLAIGPLRHHGKCDSSRILMRKIPSHPENKALIQEQTLTSTEHSP